MLLQIKTVQKMCGLDRRWDKNRKKLGKCGRNLPFSPSFHSLITFPASAFDEFCSPDWQMENAKFLTSRHRPIFRLTWTVAGAMVIGILILLNDPGNRLKMTGHVVDEVSLRHPQPEMVRTSGQFPFDFDWCRPHRSCGCEHLQLRHQQKETGCCCGTLYTCTMWLTISPTEAKG